MALKLTPVGTIQMLNENGVYTIKGNNKKMLDGDGCLYTDSYCFHGTYVFKYNTDILLGNFYYYPTNTSADGTLTIDLGTAKINTTNLTGAYSLPEWFNDLCFMLTKRSALVTFSVCQSKLSVSNAGTEQTDFLTNGGFTASRYNLNSQAPTLLGNKVSSVSNATISANKTQIVITNKQHSNNNLYFSVYVKFS